MRHHLALPLALVAVAACGGPTEPDGPPPLLTQLPRPLSAGELRIVDGVNAFSFDLLREATRSLAPDSNPFISPLSASMALGMALNGANGQTLADMQAALRFSGMTEADVNAGYRDLIELLRSLDSRTDMRVANSMWARQGFPLEQAFQEAGRTYFDAEVAALDFGSPSAAGTINGWVSDKTNGRIARLVEQIPDEVVLYLINAIYFKGKWRLPFDRDDTFSGPFHGADGVDRTASLMRLEETLAYQENEQFQAVDLLYGNGAFAMTVLLPREGGSPVEILAGLDAASWKALTAGFHEQEVQLTLPQFRVEYSRELNDDLSALGMGIAFDRGRADFYRIADVRPEVLYISRVLQKTFVEVNEEGTEAAAATSVEFGVTSAPQVFAMQVDRPFIFVIRERLSGAVMFLGVMNALGQG